MALFFCGDGKKIEAESLTRGTREPPNNNFKKSIYNGWQQKDALLQREATGGKCAFHMSPWCNCFFCNYRDKKCNPGANHHWMRGEVNKILLEPRERIRGNMATWQDGILDFFASIVTGKSTRSHTPLAARVSIRDLLFIFKTINYIRLI